MFMVDLTWCDMYTVPRTARCVIRNQPHDVHDRSQNDTSNCQVCATRSTTWCFSRGNRTPESEKKQTWVCLMNESSWPDRSRMICTEKDTRNCQVCDTRSTTWCSWSISHDVICDTRYDIRIYLEQKGVNFRCCTNLGRYAWTESEKLQTLGMSLMNKVGMIDHKIADPRYMSWMKVVGMIDHVWYALKMIPGTARYVIRNRTGLLVSCHGKAHPCQDGTEAYGERNPALQ